MRELYFGYYDKDGTKLGRLDYDDEDDMQTMIRVWDPAYRRVASDHVGDIYISTVFLPIDHSFGSGPPLLFETMVFGMPAPRRTFRQWARREEVYEREFQWRYPTQELAEHFHEIIVQAVRDGKRDLYEAMGW